MERRNSLKTAGLAAMATGSSGKCTAVSPGCKALAAAKDAKERSRSSDGRGSGADPVSVLAHMQPGGGGAAARPPSPELADAGGSPNGSGGASPGPGSGGGAGRRASTSFDIAPGMSSSFVRGMQLKQKAELEARSLPRSSKML